MMWEETFRDMAWLVSPFPFSSLSFFFPEDRWYTLVADIEKPYLIFILIYPG